MATVGEKIDIKKAQKGDFIYFKGRSTKTNRVGHVALIIKADSGQITMMHSCHRGVTLEKYNNSDYYKSRFLMVRHYSLYFEEFYRLLHLHIFLKRIEKVDHCGEPFCLG